MKNCPICERKLNKRYEGLVCKNNKCKLYFKLRKGWVYLDKEKVNSELFFVSQYDFNIERYENKKKWLQLKSEVLYEKKCCEVCKTIHLLEVHHILPRNSNPELGLDKENLMVLCQRCHKNIHKGDKYKFY